MQAAGSEEPAAVLRAEGITVTFGGVTALRNVSVEATAGAVTSVIGPNGAGKTTLFNVIGGTQKQQGGRVLLTGSDVSGEAPERRFRAGIARTFQTARLFGHLTVAENVYLAAQTSMRLRSQLARRVTNEVLLDAVRETLARLNLWDDRDRQSDSLSYATRRRVEVARALVSRPVALLLDEPMAGMVSVERTELARLFTEIAGEGVAVVLIEHDVDVVMSISNSVFVLDHGELIASGPPAVVQREAAVIAAYLGTAPNE